MIVALYLVSFHESIMMSTSEPIKCPYRRWFKCKTAMDIKRDEVLISKDLLLLIRSGGSGASGSSAAASSSLQSKQQFTENTVITEDIGFEGDNNGRDRIQPQQQQQQQQPQQQQQFKVEEVVAVATETVSPQQDKEEGAQGGQGRQELIKTEFRPRAPSPKYGNDGRDNGGSMELNILRSQEAQERWNTNNDNEKEDAMISPRREKRQRDNLEQQDEEDKIPFFILKRIWDEARRFGNERQIRQASQVA